MADNTRAPVELRFADGESISAWERFTYRETYTDPLGSFTFTVTPPKWRRPDYRSRLQKGEEVTLHIGDQQQARCLIVERNEELSRRGYTLSVTCESMLATVYEGSADPYAAQTFQADTPIKEVVLSVFAPYGFDSIVTDTAAAVTAISGKSLSGRAAPVTLDDLTHKDVAAQQQEAAYGLVARLFTRLGLVMRTDHDGQLLLGAPDFGQQAAYTVVQDVDRRHGGDRMLLEPPIRVHDSNKGQFSEVIVAGKSADRRGQLSATQPVAGVRVNDIARPSDAPFPNASFEELERGRHSYRGPWKPRYRLDKKSRDLDRCQNFAELMNGVRAARAFTVKHAVDGLRSASGNRIWAVDTVGRVIAEDFEIDEDMWLLDRTMTGNRKGGQLTMLTWIPLNSLLLGGS